MGIDVAIKVAIIIPAVLALAYKTNITNIQGHNA